MKLWIIAIIAASILAESIKSQLISASYSLISGSPWTGAVILPSYPSSYGVFSAGNKPGGQAGHKIVVYNNLIYSFLGYTSSSVWAFNITDRTWAWMAGRSTSSDPSYGTQGASAGYLSENVNTPGCRWDFGGDIHRARGEYVLYGGIDGGGERGDLWTFNFLTNTWTWLAGSSSLDERPVYSENNELVTPGARIGSGLVFYPSTGEFLLYGGLNNGQYLSDMWSLDFNNLRWAWISGSSAANCGASLGLKGEWSTGFYPGSRMLFSLAIDRDIDILYIFGGVVASWLSSDLWGFKRATLEWALLSGNNTVNTLANCGRRGYPGPNVVPGARYYHSLVYHSPSEMLIMSGGYGFACYRTGTEPGYLDETWAFNTSSNIWAWIAGSTLANNVPLNYNEYGPQFANAMAADSESLGILYTYGGSGYLSLSISGISDYLWTANVTFPVTPKVSDKVSSRVGTRKGSSFLEFPSTKSATDINSQFDITSKPQRNLSKKDTSQKTTTIFTKLKLWSTSYQLLAGIIVVLFVILCGCVLFKWSRLRKNCESSVPAETTSPAFSSYQTSCATTSITRGQTTLENSTIGVYLPGGLQVDGNLAFKPMKEIARGGGGSVWLATAFDFSLKEYGDTVIVKIPNGKQMTKRTIALFHQEIALMNAFRQSHHIARLIGYSENPHSTIFKYYRNGSLSKWILSKNRTLRQSHAFISDISAGVSLLHNNGIVHCDLKPDNVLIDSGWRLSAVITDFGISRIVTDKLLNVGAYQVQLIKGASISYAAPEVIEELRGRASGKPPIETMARDIYSMGLIMMAMLNGNGAWK